MKENNEFENCRLKYSVLKLKGSNTERYQSLFQKKPPNEVCIRINA